MYLFRVLLALNLSHGVEGVSIRQGVSIHAEVDQDLLASAGHPAHHLGVLHRDAGCGDPSHPHLVVLPACMRADRQKRLHY